jgi:hypothetical protein
MIEFEQFVARLGPHADRYTPEQLRQFHIEIQKLVNVLLDLRRAGILPIKSSKQPTLDRAGTDRTLETALTEREDVPASSLAPIS